jgi:pimeloyl-ACP methyl ester carboxylesterase
MTYTFVLVHGAFHDGSAWKRVIRRLNQLRHSAVAPTVAGHGPGASREVSHAEATRSVVDFIVERDLNDIVLVGHSYGGTIISKAAEAIPNRIRRLVFFSALVLHDGETVLEAFPPATRLSYTAMAARSRDNTVMLPFDLWRELFINDADFQLARASYAQLSPVPFQQLIEPLDLKTFYALQTPRSFLIGTDDTALPPGEWGWHPRLSSRLGVYRLVQMPGSHELMFTNPIGLADKIIEAARD